MSESSDSTAPTTETTMTATTTEATDTEAPTVESLLAEVEKWKTASRKHEQRSKDNSAASKELEQLRQAAMSEQERAVAQAVEAATAETRTAVSSEWAEDLFRTLATDRIDDVDAVLTGLNLASFIDENGRPNREALASFVDRLAPKSTSSDGPAWPDLGQGSRTATSTQALNGDGLENSLKAALGMR